MQCWVEPSDGDHSIYGECICYSANEALNINVLKAADAGGSMLIHTFGAYFGLAVSVMLYRKKASDHPRNSATYRSDLFSMIGKYDGFIHDTQQTILFIY